MAKWYLMVLVDSSEGWTRIKNGPDVSRMCRRCVQFSRTSSLSTLLLNDSVKEQKLQEEVPQILALLQGLSLISKSDSWKRNEQRNKEKEGNLEQC